MEDFVKETIVQVLTIAHSLRDNADHMLQRAIEQQINKKVSIAMIESDRYSNSFVIYRASDIKLKVKGIEICIWTVD